MAAKTYALTIWQPWASLIMLGHKEYEFRPWAAPRSIVGQRIVIHAGARKARDDEMLEIILGESESCWPRRRGSHLFELMEEFLQRVRRGEERLPVSVGLGTVLLGQPKRATELTPGDDRVREDMWGWPVSEPQLFAEPIAARGAQGFWHWAPEPDLFGARELCSATAREAASK